MQKFISIKESGTILCERLKVYLHKKYTGLLPTSLYNMGYTVFQSYEMDADVCAKLQSSTQHGEI